jgi:hypothetical protein
MIKFGLQILVSTSDTQRQPNEVAATFTLAASVV